MSITEYFYWLRYYNEKPFGDLRADLRLAQSSAILHSPYLKTGGAKLKVTDYMLNFEENKYPDKKTLFAKIKVLEQLLESRKSNVS